MGEREAAGGRQVAVQRHELLGLMAQLSTEPKGLLQPGVLAYAKSPLFLQDGLRRG
jgi:hypothetical protein